MNIKKKTYCPADFGGKHLFPNFVRGIANPVFLPTILLSGFHGMDKSSQYRGEEAEDREEEAGT